MKEPQARVYLAFRGTREGCCAHAFPEQRGP